MNESYIFFYLAGCIAGVMLVWNTIEVGRNDAANIVNAVFGARVMKRKWAVRIAGLAVILGAVASSQVMETARKGIFDPTTISLTDALAIYLAVYITNTVLLFSFSSYGMPVSTTATLVFALLGGGYAVGGYDTIQWISSGRVILGIILSIIFSGIIGFFIQRAFRGAIGQECEDTERVRLHGPWIAAFLMTGLVYFMLIKGMSHVDFVASIQKTTFEALGAPAVLTIVFAVLAFLSWMALRLGGEIIQKNLFAGMAVLGMLATAIAFGQNDLANCASPGVSSLMILQHLGEDVKMLAEVPVSIYLLLLCGVLLALGMATRTAQRVTRAEVNTGSQGDVVRLYAPKWCVTLAKQFIKERKPDEALAPEPHFTEKHKLQHYDALRAAVITSVSGSVIAFASGMGLPVSTTYVAFAAVIATGWADRIFVRGDAHLKMGRTIWVVFCWFISAFIARHCYWYLRQSDLSVWINWNSYLFGN